MTSISIDLQDHLAQDATTLATCWLLIPRTGNRLGFTDHDRALKVDNVLCEPESGLIGSEARQSSGFDADDQEVSGALTSDALSVDDLVAGRFDGAVVQTWRVNWQQPEQVVLVRSGYVGEIRRSNHAFSAEVRGFSSAMEQKQGRLYQYACDARLGDGRCGVKLDQPNYRFDGKISRIYSPTDLEIECDETLADAHLSLGYIQLAGGTDSPQQMDILSHRKMDASHRVELWLPHPAGLAEGADIVAFAGCDKQFHTCCHKFGNNLNFQGFPHIPGNDFVLSYPRAGQNHDGRALVSEADR